MTAIHVAHSHGHIYRVTVEEASGTSTHEVAIGPTDLERYAPGATPEALLEASFRFLLDRETKASILARFDLQVIERYFPDYPVRVSAYLSR